MKYEEKELDTRLISNIQKSFMENVPEEELENLYELIEKGEVIHSEEHIQNFLLSIEKAIEEIKQNKGKLYDASVVDACLRLFYENKYSFASI